jgi:hypothetical protein
LCLCFRFVNTGVSLPVQKLNIDEIEPRSQSYQTLISSFFRFLLLGLSICSTRNCCLYFEMAKLSIKKTEKSLFYKEKKFGRIDSRSQIHPNLTSKPFLHTKSCKQLVCTYSLDFVIFHCLINPTKLCYS